MGSPVLKLDAQDVARGIAVAVGGAVVVSVLTVLGGIINTPAFDLWAVDWGTVGHTVVNTAIVSGFAALTGYLMKNLFSDESGKLFGKI